MVIMSPERKFLCLCIGLITATLIWQAVNSEKRLNTLFDETLKELKKVETPKPNLTIVPKDDKDV